MAVKIGHIKAWFSTKSAHYNDDIEEIHDPAPLLFDTISDPAEAHPLDYSSNTTLLNLVELIKDAVQQHKQSLADAMVPRTLKRDSRYIPCVDPTASCRTFVPNDSTTGTTTS